MALGFMNSNAISAFVNPNAVTDCGPNNDCTIPTNGGGSGFDNPATGGGSGGGIITLTGDVHGTGSSQIITTIQNTGVIPGQYPSPSLVIDSDGRINQVQPSVVPPQGGQGQILRKRTPNSYDLEWGTVGGTGTVISVTMANGIGTIGNGTVTASGSLHVDLDNTPVIPGNYNNAELTVDEHGRLTYAANGKAAASSSSFDYKADAQSTSPTDPGTGKFRYNNTDQANATMLIFDWIDNNGFDAHVFFLITARPSYLQIQDKDFALNYQQFIIDDVIEFPDYFQVLVHSIGVSGPGTFKHNTICSVLLVNQGVSIPAGGTTGQFLRKNSNEDHDAGWHDLANTDVSNALGYVPVSPANSVIHLTGPVTGNAIGNTIATTITPTGVGSGTYTKLTVNPAGQAVTGGQISNTDVEIALGYKPADAANAAYLPLAGGTMANGASIVLPAVNGANSSIIFRKSTTSVNPASITYNNNVFGTTGLAIQGGGYFSANASAIQFSAGGNALVVSGGVGVVGTLTVRQSNYYSLGEYINLSFADSNEDTVSLLRIGGDGSVINSATANAYISSDCHIDIRSPLVTINNAPVSIVSTLIGDVIGNAVGNTIATTLTNTTVVPGVYSTANVTVNAQGRITNISTGNISATGVTSVAIANTANIQATGSPITSSGTFTLDLTNTGITATGAPGYYPAMLERYGFDAKGRLIFRAAAQFGSSGDVAIVPGVFADPYGVTFYTTLNPTGVTAGTYTKLTVDAKGRILVGANLSNTDISNALGFTPISTANSVNKLVGDVIGNAVGNTIATTLTNTSVIPGSYATANVTVNSQGRITSITTGNIPATGVTSVAIASGSSAIEVSGSPIVSSGTITLDLSDTGSAGTYTKVTTDNKGRVTAGAQLSNTDVSNAIGYVPVNTANSVNRLTGNVTGTAIGNTIATTLATSGVVAGTYTKLTVNAKGLATTGAQLASANVTTALGFTPVSIANSVNRLIGDVIGNTAVGNSITTILSNTGVIAGSYSTANVVVDSKGRITSISNGNGVISGGNYGDTGFYYVSNTVVGQTHAILYSPPLSNTSVSTLTVDLTAQQKSGTAKPWATEQYYITYDPIANTIMATPSPTGISHGYFDQYGGTYPEGATLDQFLNIDTPFTPFIANVAGKPCVAFDIYTHPQTFTVTGAGSIWVGADNNTANIVTFAEIQLINDFSGNLQAIQGPPGPIGSQGPSGPSYAGIEVIATPTITAGTLTINCIGPATIFNVSLNANITTLNFTNVPSSGAFAITLHLTADGTGRAITWGANVKWPGGIAPTVTSTLNKVDTYVFETSNAGVPWFGYISGQNF